MTVRCEFPFDHEGGNKYACVELAGSSDFFCKANISGKPAWGQCNSDCLDDFHSN
jgi:hypothetical protein